jgi:hypothetical protein
MSNVASKKSKASSVQFTLFSFILKEKISDAQIGRVNTFPILQTIRNGPSNFKLCMKRLLRFSNFLILSTLFYFLTSNYSTKMPPDLFHGQICWSKLSFSHSESEFVWEWPLILKIQKFWVRHYLLNTKLLNKSAIRWWHL